MPYFVADGSERIADVTIQPIRDESGRVLFLAPTGIDITDRRRAEAEREKFVTLVENSTDFIGMCDLDGVPFFVNRAGLDAGRPRRHRRGPPRTGGIVLLSGRSAQDHRRSSFRRSSKTGHGEIEVRFRHFKTGEARWMAYKVLTLPDAAGRPIAFATVSQDVTERKRLEDNLRRLAADLSEADRRKNEFLAMLAHELRNPLAPISNAARALRLSDGDGGAAAIGVRDAGAAGRPDGAAGGRPARHEPHHARQDRAPQRARRAGADRPPGRRSGAWRSTGA